MSLAPGTRIGPYEIVSMVGAGGMGEVYRARDPKLQRDVALKILPEILASEPDRLARFRREARTLAALNHPHIAAIYGFEENAGTYALALEFVDGETLADRIARGRIPLEEALPFARQIADALEAAHEHGIIHRDLKPANVKVRGDGTVKVLDFGLAKAMAPAGEVSPGVAQSPTITSPAMMTGVGMLLGTAAYMSPEQARGKAADKRSDIWAFGCVLYEMLTGKRAFEGDDVGDTLANVLKTEPDWTALPAGTAPSIRRLLRRCLAKDRARRLSDAVSARLEIDEASSQEATGQVPAYAMGRLERGRVERRGHRHGSHRRIPHVLVDRSAGGPGADRAFSCDAARGAPLLCPPSAAARPLGRRRFDCVRGAARTNGAHVRRRSNANDSERRPLSEHADFLAG